MKHCLLTICIFLISSGFKSGSGQLIVQLKGLKTGKGQLFISLFSTEEGFPDQPVKALKTWSLPADPEIDLGHFPAGTYALALLHDLDGNRKMTYSFLGMPQDGYSSSPDGGAKWSKPVFSKAKFNIGPGTNRLTLKVHY